MPESKKWNAEKQAEASRKWRLKNPGYVQKWQQENQDKVRQYHKRRQSKAEYKEYQENWRIQNREKCRAYVAKWQSKNISKTKAYRKKRYEDNREESIRRVMEWRLKNKDKVASAKKRHYMKDPKKQMKKNRINRLKKYGMSPEDFDKMILSQKNRCLICSQEFSADNTDKAMRASVDHCHKTGRVRGILHGKCNWILGTVEKKKEFFTKAIEYLAKHDESITVTIWKHGRTSWFQQEGHPPHQAINFTQ